MFGERLQLLRKERGLTQKDIADLIKAAPSTVGMYEQGRRDPDTETVKKLADYFNVPLDYLLGRTDVREPKADKITDALADDPELREFWNDLKEREDLQLLFKQTRALSKKDVQQIIRIIKTFEEEEKNNR